MRVGGVSSESVGADERTCTGEMMCVSRAARVSSVDATRGVTGEREVDCCDEGACPDDTVDEDEDEDDVIDEDECAADAASKCAF